MRLLALSPTDSVRDRLAAYFHWGDLQSLEVALEIAVRNRVAMKRIAAWSRDEGHTERFAEFQRRLDARRRERR